MGSLSKTIQALQSTLDSLCSSHSSTSKRTLALTSLEQFLVTLCVPKGSELSSEFEAFLESQDAFECNIPSRVLSWISSAIVQLEILVNKGSLDQGHEEEASVLSSHLIQSLSIVQGVVLNHKPSKKFLGRKYSLQILLDLLLVSRHLSSSPSGHESSSVFSNGQPNKKLSSPQLASAVLDTLLCILVDSSVALRAFEEASGVQVVVKILKRAGTPREVRMKCLEFLYFYLLDERSFAAPSTIQRRTGSESSLPTLTPKSPTSQTFEENSDGKLLPAFSFDPRSKVSCVSSSSDSSFGSSQSSDSSSFSSAFSLLSQGSDSSWSSVDKPRTPPRSRTQSSASKSLLMLRKEVDFVPMSPKKAQIAGLGIQSSRTSSSANNKNFELGMEPSPRSEKENNPYPRSSLDDNIKTTEEKKRLLGSMLGNVDALVEGVKKAGIWGLG